MSLKTRVDKLSPLPSEAQRLQQAHSAWLFANVLSQDCPGYTEAMKNPLPPAPQAFLDAHVYDPNSRQALYDVVMGDKS